MPTRTAANLADFVHADERLLTGNRCFGKAGLADHATAHEDVLTANAIPYAIAGVLYSKAAVAKIDLSALATLDETGTALTPKPQAAGETRVYLLAIDKDGTIAIVQAATAGTGAGTGGGNCPGCPPGYAPFGAVKVVNGSAAAFVFGVTAKTDAGLTVTYYDLTMAPETL